MRITLPAEFGAKAHNEPSPQFKTEREALPHFRNSRGALPQFRKQQLQVAVKSALDRHRKLAERSQAACQRADCLIAAIYASE